jgi:hypothetical protein
MKYKGFLEGSRFANISSFLRKLAIVSDVDIDLQSEKGFFTETAFYTLDGEPKNINSFVKNLQVAVKVHNEE